MSRYPDLGGSPSRPGLAFAPSSSSVVLRAAEALVWVDGVAPSSLQATPLACTRDVLMPRLSQAVPLAQALHTLGGELWREECADDAGAARLREDVWQVVRRAMPMQPDAGGRLGPAPIFAFRGYGNGASDDDIRDARLRLGVLTRGLREDLHLRARQYAGQLRSAGVRIDSALRAGVLEDPCHSLGVSGWLLLGLTDASWRFASSRAFGRLHGGVLHACEVLARHSIEHGELFQPLDIDAQTGTLAAGLSTVVQPRAVRLRPQRRPALQSDVITTF